jgi:transcriptional regulator with XRE-family HTH domain
MPDARRFRQLAKITQTEAAVRAGVSPMLARNYERFGDAAVEDSTKLDRLRSVYEGFRRDVERRGGRAA